MHGRIGWTNQDLRISCPLFVSFFPLVWELNSKIGEGEVGRYDILIFTPPDEPGMLYVKRVVGLPGETIEVKDGKVYADGAELDNSFTKAPQNRRGDGVYKVPEGHYFFLGDNRNNSNDSRFWKQKYVPAANLKAKARLITFPFTRIGWL